MPLSLPSSEFDLPKLGTVSTRPNSVGVMSWYLRSEGAGKWQNASEFMRFYLLDACEPKSGSQSSYATKVEYLAEDELESAATALLEACYSRSIFELPDDVNPRPQGCAGFLEAVNTMADEFEISNSKLVTSSEEQIQGLKNLYSLTVRDANWAQSALQSSLVGSFNLARQIEAQHFPQGPKTARHPPER